MPTVRLVSPAHRRMVAEYEASFSYEDCADTDWAIFNAHNNAHALAMANDLSWWNALNMASRHVSAVKRDQNARSPMWRRVAYRTVTGRWKSS